MLITILLELTGAIALTIGVFSPSFTAAGYTIMYLVHSPLSGVALVVLAISTIVFITKGKHRTILYCGIISIGIIILSVITLGMFADWIIDRLGVGRSTGEAIKSAIDSFSGLSWGWFLIISGPIMLIFGSAHFVKTEHKSLVEKKGNGAATVAAGLTAVILGTIGIISWWDCFTDLFLGCLPIIFGLGGGLALYRGVTQVRDSIRYTNSATEKADLMAEVEKLKQEIRELKKAANPH